MNLSEALEREHKFAEPTPAELGMPAEVMQLYRLESSFAAPRTAWRAYYAAIGAAAAEAEERERRRPNKHARRKRGGR